MLYLQKLQWQTDKDLIQKEADLDGVANHVLSTESFKALLTMDRPKEFGDLYDAAVVNYIKGKWDVAKDILEECMKLDQC